MAMEGAVAEKLVFVKARSGLPTGFQAVLTRSELWGEGSGQDWHLTPFARTKRGGSAFGAQGLDRGGAIGGR